MSPDRDDVAPTEATPPSAPSHVHGRFLPGAVIGRYRIVALAGRGGMGEVYRADDLKIGQAVALKFLPVDFERDPERLERLLGEVRIARQVSHPNVCRVYDVGEFQGHHFITMEYIDGEDLAALLRRIGRLPQEKALDLTRQIAAGLAAAHVQGIVHRDLKPANIMLDGKGRARITDFGLAAAVEALRGETQWGTPGYMAPEQLAGGEATQRTDVYALGLVLYEMFTGRRAFEASAKPDSGRTDVPARPSSLVPGLDPAIDAAILKCLEKDSVRRPSSAVELLAALPGGDPLAAALQAGETPTPEMVAAAGEEGAVSPGRAWGLFGLTLIAIAAAIFSAARLLGLDQVPMTRTPEALREKAREMAQILGNDVPPRASAWWVNLDRGYLEFSRKHPATPSLAATRPTPIRFYYRESPELFRPTASFLVTRRDPAPVWGGEAYVALDPQGRLLEFARLAPQVEAPDSVGSPPDWNALIALTGADVATLREAQPLWTPDVPCDTRRAWVGTNEGQPVRYEAAAWRGKPVWLRTIATWERHDRNAAMRTGEPLSFALFTAMVLATVLAFVALARHNLRLGRSDRVGAARVATTVFLLFASASALEFPWALDAELIWRWVLREPYFPGLAAWALYLGIEPFLRRRWPHRLIAWARLLEGRFVDPIVGRQLLIGTVIGSGMALGYCIQAAVGRRQDLSALALNLPFGRAAHFFGATVAALPEGLINALGAFAVLLLLRVLLRRDIAAWVALGILLILTNLPPGHVSLLDVVGLILTNALLLCAMRVGLLAAAAAIATTFLLGNVTPLTLDFTRWYAWQTVAIATLLAVIAAWGFRGVMGRRKILSAAMFEG